MVYAMYIRCWRVQPGVAEQSDADDRLQSALENQFQSGFMQNVENTITGYVFKIVDRNMCVVRIIEGAFFPKKGLCDLLETRYLYIR